MTRLALAVEPGAVPAARRFIGRLDLPEPPREDAELLVSELVANAVVHGGLSGDEQIELRVQRDRALRVEVCHPGEGFDVHARARSSDEPGGWGLRLVATVAEDWGVQASEGTTCVWFTCPIEADAGRRLVP